MDEYPQPNEDQTKDGGNIDTEPKDSLPLYLTPPEQQLIIDNGYPSPIKYLGEGFTSKVYELEGGTMIAKVSKPDDGDHAKHKRIVDLFQTENNNLNLLYASQSEIGIRPEDVYTLKIYDFINRTDRPIIIEEKVSGRPLLDIYNSHEISEGQAVEIVTQIAHLYSIVEQKNPNITKKDWQEKNFYIDQEMMVIKSKKLIGVWITLKSNPMYPDRSKEKELLQFLAN